MHPRIKCSNCPTKTGFLVRANSAAKNWTVSMGQKNTDDESVSLPFVNGRYRYAFIIHVASCLAEGYFISIVIGVYNKKG